MVESKLDNLNNLNNNYTPPPMVTVRLFGVLKEKYIDKLQLAANHLGDIINGLKANFSSFIDEIKQGSFYIYTRNINNKNKVKDLAPLVESETPINFYESVEVCIVPVIKGSGGFLKIVLGIALIGAALLIPGAGFLIGIGASLLLGGITDLFSPTVKTPKKYERQDSHLFNDNPNVSNNADPIPLLYGTYLLQNIPYISTNVSKAPTYS